MIVYKLTAGFASDLRHEDGTYVLKAGEVKHADGFGTLPALDFLHDSAWVRARDDQQALQVKRAAALRALEEQRLAAAIVDPSAPQEVKDYAGALAVKGGG